MGKTQQTGKQIILPFTLENKNIIPHPQPYKTKCIPPYLFNANEISTTNTLLSAPYKTLPRLHFVYRAILQLN